MKLRILQETYNKILREREQSQLNSKKHYIAVAKAAGFDDDLMAQQHVENILSKVKSLPSELKLYRVVFVADPTQINKNQVGSHYVMKQSDLDNSHYVHSHVGEGSPYLLTAKAPISLVDVHQTIMNNIQYPHENEITLKNKGVGANIINVTPFNPKDDEDDFLSQGFDDDFGDNFY